jgi:quinol monooxygenase YgiN
MKLTKMPRRESGRTGVKKKTNAAAKGDTCNEKNTAEHDDESDEKSVNLVIHRMPRLESGITRMPRLESGRTIVKFEDLLLQPQNLPKPPSIKPFTWMPRIESGRPPTISLPKTSLDLKDKALVALNNTTEKKLDPDMSGEIFRLNVTICVKSERRDDFIKCILNNQRCTLSNEPLAISYVFGEDTMTPNTFHFVEAYKGERGFEEHKASPHFAEWEKFASTNPFTAAPKIHFFKEFHVDLHSTKTDGISTNDMKDVLKSPSLD